MSRKKRSPNAAAARTDDDLPQPSCCGCDRRITGHRSRDRRRRRDSRADTAAPARRCRAATAPTGFRRDSGIRPSRTASPASRARTRPRWRAPSPLSRRSSAAGRTSSAAANSASTAAPRRPRRGSCSRPTMGHGPGERRRAPFGDGARDEETHRRQPHERHEVRPWDRSRLDHEDGQEQNRRARRQ